MVYLIKGIELVFATEALALSHKTKHNLKGAIVSTKIVFFEHPTYEDFTKDHKVS